MFLLTAYECPLSRTCDPRSAVDAVWTVFLFQFEAENCRLATEGLEIDSCLRLWINVVNPLA